MATPTPIKNKEHLQAIITAVDNRLASVNLEAMIHQLVEIIPDEALYFMASQLDVLGAKGWNLINDSGVLPTTEELRDLIRAAIGLHRIAGTPAAITGAINRAGWPTVTVTETGPGWAWYEFEVNITITATTPVISAELYALIVAIIEAWKPVRSQLRQTNHLYYPADRPTVQGEATIEVYDTSVLVATYVVSNLVVNTGLVGLAQAVITSSYASDMTVGGVGTGGTAPAAGDTALTGAFTKAFTSATSPSTGVARFNYEIATTESNGVTIQEVGLYYNPGVLTLFSRAVFPAVAKTSAIELRIQWDVTFLPV